MNIQTVTSATKRAAATARKPRNAVDLSLVVTIVLTVLAALPYELGKVATVVFPPEWKPYVAGIGTLAATILGILRPFLRSPNLPPPEPPDA